MIGLWLTNICSTGLAFRVLQETPTQQGLGSYFGGWEWRRIPNKISCWQKWSKRRLERLFHWTSTSWWGCFGFPFGWADSIQGHLYIFRLENQKFYCYVLHICYTLRHIVCVFAEYCWKFGLVWENRRFPTKPNRAHIWIRKG